jgi:hypothetical protein
VFLAGHGGGGPDAASLGEGEELAALLSGLSNDELAEGISQLHGLICALEARLCSFVAPFAGRKAFAEDGCGSMGEWLSARLAISLASGRRYAKVAEALGSLPHLRASFAGAEVTIEQLAPVVRIATAENDAALAAELPSYSVAQAELLARRKQPVDKDEEACAHDKRFLSLRRSGQCTRVAGLLSGLDGETVRVALERIAEGYGKNPETGSFDPFSARMADALTELAGGRIAADADPDRADVVIHVDAEVLAGNEDGPAESGSGAPLSSEAARRAACDCRYHLWVRDSLSGTFDLGRATRSIPPHLARYLHLRDQGCRFPGCAATRLVEGHHLWHWADFGPTDRSNLASLCRRHHRLVHEGGWHAEGDGEGTVYFVSPDGRRFGSRRPPLRAEMRARFFGGAGVDPPEESAPAAAATRAGP